MKKAPKFIDPIIASTNSKMDPDSFDRSVEEFKNKKYLDSFYSLLDYINPEFRKKYGNKDNTEFSVPHGSIIINIKIEGAVVKIDSPFLNVPKENRIPLLRQVADLNMNTMVLAQLYLRGDELYFEYSCPLSMADPWKMYYVIEDICYTGDKYDDEFVEKFNAKRLYEPKITPYSEEDVDNIYKNIQDVIDTCLTEVSEFEKDRKYGYAWHLVDITLEQILYFASPEGNLLNDMKKEIWDMDRDERTPLTTIITDGKKTLERIKKMSKNELKKDLYYTETFISPKRRSSLPNIQENFTNTYDRAKEYMGTGDNRIVVFMILNRFYQLYFYNNVQDDVNEVVVNAMKRASEKDWDEASDILYKAMGNIVKGDLSVSSSGVFGKIFSGLFK